MSGARVTVAAAVGSAHGERWLVRRGRASLPHPEPMQDDLGRWLVSRSGAEGLSGRHINFIRRLCEQQRRRWEAAEQSSDEAPLEVRCELGTRVVLLDIDVLTELLRDKPMRNPRQRKAAPVE